MSLKIFGREPAALLAFFAVAVKLLAAFGVGLSVDQQSVLNAVAAAVVGLVVAFVTHDGASAALYGFAQSALALAVGFGLQWSADQQAIVLSAVSVVVAMFVRTQVTAPAKAAAAVAAPLQPVPPSAPSGV